MLETFCQTHQIPLATGVPLDKKCTFQIGGPADYFLEPACMEQLAALLPFLRQKAIPYLILGRGSNMLFADTGFRGAVVGLGDNFSEITLADEATIFCQSGASLNRLCRFAWEQGLTGLEFAHGIPGSVGGAVYMNAGAYGGEMKDVLLASYYVDPDGTVGALNGEEQKLGYRTSAYAGGDRVITGAVLRLQKGDKDTIQARMEELMNRRRTNQPLEYPSAGSTFKRPEGAFAAALIDQCGLKGLAVGGAQVSEKHAGFVINTGGATGADVRQLMAQVRQRVQEETGYVLEPEVVICD